jgi:hypothetical protein
MENGQHIRLRILTTDKNTNEYIKNTNIRFIDSFANFLSEQSCVTKTPEVETQRF